jgi:aspartyl-tRNA(Asn)/glutamyl-tRNA(Gln) amidotransferase subunit A
MSESALLEMNIQDIAARYRDGTLSPVQVTEATLDRIAATEPFLHAWVLVDAETALTAAHKAERELREGVDRGPLHGVPFGIKDIFDVAGWPTRCGSAARDDVSPATEDAAIVATLRQGGAVFIGKTVTQEFAAGVVSAPARNPWDPARIPGGSSGGSAAALAAGGCFGALGSDTGGSIRIPAAACGVVGFKPAFGALDVSGVFPLSWSLDTVGPLARTVDDAWLIWQVLRAGSASSMPPLRELSTGDPQSLRIGVPREFFFEWIQPDVSAAVETSIERLRERGANVVDVAWDLAAAARACSFIINRVETTAVHERTAIADPARFRQYGAELRLRIAAGRTIPATAYVHSLRVRDVVRDSVAALFGQHDLDAILVPTLPTTALPADHLVIEGTGRDEGIGAGWTRLTMPFNATGQPVLAVPSGHDQSGLPVGVQLAGRPGHEATLLQIGRLLEGVAGDSRVHLPLVVRAT